MGTSNGQGPSQPPSSEEQPGGQSSMLPSEAALERFAKSFEASARRWELIVYPSLFAFIILAAYGFFLIYSLTKDMHTLANSMDPDMGDHMTVMSGRMQELSINIADMTERIAEMRTDVSSMNRHMGVMEREMVSMSENTDTLKPMLINIASMNASMQTMTSEIGVMTGSMTQMSWDMYQIKRPMNMMNQFMPW